MPLVNPIRVDVAFAATPNAVEGVNGNAPPPDDWSCPHPNVPLVHVRKNPPWHVARLAPKSCVVEATVEVITVVDAYTNCDDATVEEAKNTPCVQIELEVAAVVVPKVVPRLKPDPPPPPPVPQTVPLLVILPVASN